MSSLHDEIKRELPRLEGWVTAERGCEMADLIVANKPKVCVELGVFGGRSLIAQALALRENGRGVIYGIDPWKVEAALEGENDANKEWWSKNVDLHFIHTGTMNAIWRLNLDKWAVVIRAKAEDAQWTFQGGIDHLFIDGNHSEVSSCRDVNSWTPLVRPSGTIIFDDANWPSTQKAIAILNGCCDLIKDAGDYRIYRKK